MTPEILLKLTESGLRGDTLREAVLITHALQCANEKEKSPIQVLMGQLRKLKNAKTGKLIYKDVSAIDVRFIAADYIYTQNRHSLEWVDQKSDGVIKAAKADGEILGFLEVVVSTDVIDSDGQKFTPAAIDMGQHTAAYKAYRYGHKVIDGNHNLKGNSDIIPVESYPIDEKETDKDGKEAIVHKWKQVLYLADPSDRKLAADGEFTGISVYGDALGMEV